MYKLAYNRSRREWQLDINDETLYHKEKKTAIEVIIKKTSSKLLDMVNIAIKNNPKLRNIAWRSALLVIDNHYSYSNSAEEKNFIANCQSQTNKHKKYLIQSGSVGEAWAKVKSTLFCDCVFYDKMGLKLGKSFVCKHTLGLRFAYGVDAKKDGVHSIDFTVIANELGGVVLND